MIRLKFGGLLLAVFLLLSFGLTASAQYTIHITVRFQGKCYDAPRIINQYLPNGYDVSFPTQADCEASRARFNQRISEDGCTLTITSSPCTGSPLGGSTEPGSGTIYKGSGSTYSANQANEVKDWAKDNATLARIIGGQNATLPRAAKTGDDAFDKLMQDDMADEETELPKDGEQNERVVRDDRPGFDDDAFKGTFRSLGQDNHSDDFKFVDPFKVQKAPVLEKVSTEVRYTPAKESFTSDSPSEEDKSFLDKAYDKAKQFKENLVESDGFQQAKDLAQGACETMTMSKITSALSPLKGAALGVVGTIKNVADVGNFYKNYTMDIFDNFKDKTMEAVKTGKVPDYNWQEFKDRADDYARRKTASAVTGGMYNAASSYSWGR